MPDIVRLITSQHRQMDELLAQAMEEGSDKIALLRQVSALLVPHSEAEEDFVYPTIRDLDSEEESEVKDGTAEHHHIEGLMQELLGEDPDGPGFDGKLAALVGELRHHVEEEESDLLPVLAEQADADARAELGSRFAERTKNSDDSRADEPRLDLDGSAGKGPGAGQGESSEDGPTKAELYEQAKEQDVSGRSTMSKEELARAVDPR